MKITRLGLKWIRGRTVLLLCVTLAGCQKDPDCGSDNSINAVKRIALGTGISWDNFLTTYLQQQHVLKVSNNALPDYQVELNNLENESKTLNNELAAASRRCENDYRNDKRIAFSQIDSICDNYFTEVSFEDNLKQMQNDDGASKKFGGAVSLKSTLSVFLESELNYWHTNFQPLLLKREENSKRFDAARKSKLAAEEKDRERFSHSIEYKVENIRLEDKNTNTKAVSCVAKLIINSDWGGASKEVRYKIEHTSDGGNYLTLYQLTDAPLESVAE